MDYQYDRKYAPIGTDGCYFVSLGVWAEESGSTYLTPQQVNEAYAHAVEKGWMTFECFISDPAAICNYFLEQLGSDKKVLYIGWWNTDTGVSWFGPWLSEDIDFEIERYNTRTGYHFKTPGFDPYPELYREADISGRRYFKVVG